MPGRGLRRWIDGLRGVFGAAPRDRGEDPGGGPFLHWVPDRDATWRLAGDFLPPPTSRRRPPTVRRRRRRHV